VQLQALRSLPLHLPAGSDIRLSLEALAAELQASGFVLSVVGHLSQAAFQCPGQGGPTILEGDLEIISLQGTIAPQGVHLHLSVSDGACQVWGGHLEPGALVGKGVDLLVGVLALEGSGIAPSTQSERARPAPPSNQEPRVEIAVLAGCPYSARALRMLRTLGIAYRVVPASGGGSFPQVRIDGVVIGGYDALAELHGRGELEALRNR